MKFYLRNNQYNLVIAVNRISINNSIYIDEIQEYVRRSRNFYFKELYHDIDIPNNFIYCL